MYIAIAAIVIVFLIFTFNSPKKEKENAHKETKKEFPFLKKNLFTKSEYAFYFKLKDFAQKNNLIIFPKIRLADILSVTCKDWNERQKHFNKIKAKHVDFILCDEKLRVIGAIELDDPTHEREERKERDLFVDEAFKAGGLKIIHIKGNYDNLDTLLQPLIPELTLSTVTED